MSDSGNAKKFIIRALTILTDAKPAIGGARGSSDINCLFQMVK